MLVGTCTIDLHLPESSSLKNKRYILQGLKKQIRNNFNVSIAEIDHHDLWQRATLGVAVVANDTKFADQVLSKIIDFIGKESRVELIDYWMETR